MGSIASFFFNVPLIFYLKGLDMNLTLTKKQIALLAISVLVTAGLFSCSGDGSSGSGSSSGTSDAPTTLVTSVNGVPNFACTINGQCIGNPIASVMKAPATMSQVSTPWTDTSTNLITLSQVPYVDGSNPATVYAKEGSVFSQTIDPSYTINGFTPGARIFKGNGLPSTLMGTFPVQSGTAAYPYYAALPGGTNPETGQTYSSAAAIGISPYNLDSKVPLNPVPTGFYTIQSLIVGVTLTGAVWHFEKAPGNGGLWYNPLNALPLDQCFGHPYYQQYHYHAYSWKCFPNQGTTGQSPVVGYALDGFPITGPRAPDGHSYTNAELDVCHGIQAPVTTPEGKTYPYHYVLNREYPYSVGCFRGQVNYDQALGPSGFNNLMKEGADYLNTAQPPIILVTP